MITAVVVVVVAQLATIGALAYGLVRHQHVRAEVDRLALDVAHVRAEQLLNGARPAPRRHLASVTHLRPGGAR